MSPLGKFSLFKHKHWRLSPFPFMNSCVAIILTKGYRSGYVGDGMLSAVACGDIFASPSMKQILAAVAAVPSDQGTILLITNYTGDKLHFGLAAERALAGGFSK